MKWVFEEGDRVWVDAPSLHSHGCVGEVRTMKEDGGTVQAFVDFVRADKGGVWLLASVLRPAA